MQHEHCICIQMQQVKISHTRHKNFKNQWMVSTFDFIKEKSQVKMMHSNALQKSS